VAQGALRVLIVGCGMMGALHAAAWHKAGAVVAGFVDERLERARELASRYGAGAWADLDQALAGAGPLDAASICTPPAFHLDAMLALAGRGVHLLVEKPPTLTAAQCREAAARVAEAGVSCMTGLTHRFYPEMRFAKEWIASGRLGEILHVSDRIEADPASLPPWYFDSAVAGGGILLTNGIHALDRVGWVMDRPARRVVWAATRNVFHPAGNVEDFAAVSVEHDGGLRSQLTLLWAPGAATRSVVEVVGTRGVLRVHSWQGVTVLTPEEKIERSFYPEDADFLQRTLVGIQAEVESFRRHLAEGHPLEGSLAEACRTMALIEDAYRLSQG